MVTSDNANSEPDGKVQVDVAMVVASDISTDTRVMKMAHDLAAAGLRVTVLCASSTGIREVVALGAARVVRLPVTDLLRSRRGRWLTAPNRFLLTRTMQVEEQEYFNYQREIGASIGWLRSDYFKARSIRNQEANLRHHRRLERQNARSLRLGRFGRIDSGLARRRHEIRKKRQARSEKRREGLLHRKEAQMQRRLDHAYGRFIGRQKRLRKRLVDNARAEGHADWRRSLPELQDYESAFGPELDRLRPDVIHAQDVHLLGVAARAASRGIVAGIGTKLIYDAHEYIQGLALPRPVAAWSSLEREYINRTDRVITVAPAIADMLVTDYQLNAVPEVVMNIPVVAEGGTDSVRAAAGVGDHETLLVYSGGLDATRGVHTLVDALGKLEGVHLALVSKATTGYTIELEDRASEGGFAERLHIVPFVAPQDVVHYLSSATLGVHTIVAGPINHEVTLPNKVFEYMHARLPIVISSCRVMSEFVADLEIGEVFVSEDVDSLAETISRVLDNLEKYHAAYERQPEMLERYSWRTERRKLFTVYRELLGTDALPEDIDRSELAPLVDMKG